MCSVGTKEEDCNDNFTLFSFSSQLGEILRSHVDKRNWWNSSMSNISDLENWKRLVLVNYFCISNIHSHCRNDRNDIQVLLPAILLSFLETAKRSTAACVCVYVGVHTHACMPSSVWLCNPMDCSLPGSFVHAIFQARVLEWVAISYSTGSSWRSNPPLLHLLCWQSDSLPLCLLGSIFMYIHLYIIYNIYGYMYKFIGLLWWLRRLKFCL